MTPAHITRAIERAKNHDSIIDADILSIKGFSTGVQRRIMSNLADLPGRPVVWEIGCFAGATACALINNKNVDAYFFENFSQDFGEIDIKTQLIFNLGVTPTLGKYTLIEEDFFQYDLRKLPKADLYYFDGEHSRASQAKALPYAFDYLSDEFVFVVDDNDWESVQLGTEDGFNSLDGRVELVESWQLTDGVPDGPNFHNGVLICLCKKI